jgi:imidazolonepropionase-like amidohydrolase
VENLAAVRDAVEINAAGRVVMPGFIDCHTHLAFPPPDASDERREAATRALAADTGKRTATRWIACLDAMARHGGAQDRIRPERRRGKEDAAACSLSYRMSCSTSSRLFYSVSRNAMP